MKHQEDTGKRTQELEELNKVKDKFFSIISHDLRSPINSLAGLLDLMEKEQIKAEELPALTKEMRVQFNHTKNLINNLLDWTLLQMNKVAIRKEKLAIKTILDENIKLLSSMSTKQTTFINEVGDDIFALADNNMINLVFRNLILNGIKFTDNGGVITITASREGNEIKVSVNDNGVGISGDIQSMLFEKTTGYSTRGTANEKGTGLGLILCKEFIERNGGKIWLQSEIGKGSTFHVTIPAG
jgi:signal transduction histidine kinase